MYRIDVISTDSINSQINFCNEVDFAGKTNQAKYCEDGFLSQ